MANNNNKTLSEKVVAVAHVIFFLEGVLSFTTGLMLMFCPSWVMEQQGFDWRNPLAADNLAQFGAVVVLMGYMGLRAPVHPRVIEALLLGDLLWVYVFARMLCTHLWDATVRWTLAAHFSLWITVFLAVARTLYLLCYHLGSRSSGTRTRSKQA